MIRFAAACALFLAAFAAPASAQSTPAPVTVAEAAPFIGDWVMEMQGPNGPGTFNVSIKVENDKVVADIGSDTLATQKVSSISKSGKGLHLSYSFPYEGNNVDAIASLIPGDEGKTAASMDFAGGAYVMTGTATKKK